MDLIKTFLYFAVFKHPLTSEEALKFCQYPTDSIDSSLKELLHRDLLFKIGPYYLPYNYPDWVERRQTGGELASKKMAKARRMAKILTYFPYVRSVMISGSLSKGYMDKNSDIDFFLIMKPGSIAISKFLMGLFRRCFAPKSFCINFIIDSENLLIEKQNLYTAIEMVTLIPMIDDTLYDKFMRANLQWIGKFLPNASPMENKALPYSKNLFQWFLEAVCSSLPMTKVDEFLRKQYVKRLQKRTGGIGSESDEVIISKGIIKLHGKPYQKKILTLYNKYQEDFFIEKQLVYEKSFYD